MPDPVVKSSNLFELLGKPDVVFKHLPDVVNVVHKRGHSLETETKGETGIFSWVNFAGPKDIRMDHTRTAELYPARAFARAASLAIRAAAPAADKAGEIKFRARLRKREIRRAKTSYRFGPK